MLYTQKVAKALRDSVVNTLVSVRYAAARGVHRPEAMEGVHPHQEKASVADRNKAVQILAKSIFRELTAQGYNEKQIVSLASALISEVTVKISGEESART
jgi:hypothetical protein